MASFGGFEVGSSNMMKPLDPKSFRPGESLEMM